eukprot:TRINITY_DN67469_c4_g6_i1.p1 TRINITY_DN67469_c4_g6~~TRINITY_DN67469_c4_g6_i1.p1  ORF type:complete len:336 (-),score=166.22 TRINITY_DN67469_c4_g6_i1:83-1090(-)
MSIERLSAVALVVAVVAIAMSSSSEQKFDIVADAQWAKENNAFVLHVLASKTYEQFHAAGSVSADVFSVKFRDNVDGITGGKRDAAVLLLGWSPATREAEEAQRQLKESGYTNTRIGFLTHWKKAGLPIEGEFDEPLTLERLLADGQDSQQTFKADTDASKLRWFGRNIFGSQHTGTLQLSSGTATLARDAKDGVAIKSAEFEIDMTSIANTDVDPKWRGVLEEHLRSDDFFATHRFPKATVELVSATPNTSECADHSHDFVAKLTLRGVTDTISFHGLLFPLEANKFALQAQIEFDRTRFGVLYGSRKFYSGLAGHYVADLLQVNVNVFFTSAS